MNLKKITRVEIINHAVSEDSYDFGRAYVYWPDDPKFKVDMVLQDKDKTLKIFITKRE